MKTFDEILIETYDSISRGEMMGVENKLSFRDIERLAAKDYAKQWVDKLYKDMNKNQGYGSVHPEYILEQIKGQIDRQ